MQRITLYLLFLFLLWRMFLFVPLWFGSTLFSYREGYDYTSIWKFIKPYSPVDSVFLYPWANFDGVYYLSIASNGYTVDNAGFFPVFPFLIRLLAGIFGQGEQFGKIQFFSALFIVHASFFTSLVVFYKLLRFNYNHKISMRVIFFLLVFPTSFYFVSIYTESVFFLLSVLSFYFARKKQWAASSVSAIILSATRIVGIAIFPVLLYEFFKQEKTFRTARIIPLLLIPLGITSYGLFNLWQWGDFFHFLQIHGTLGNSRSTDSIILFPQTIFRYIKILISVSPSVYEWWIALLEFGVFFLAVFLFYVAWKKKIRFSYLLFALLSFLIPISSGTFTGLPRYVVVLFPLFIVSALIKSKWLRFAYVTVSIVLLGLLLMLFSLGYFVA
ncbi:MAG: hypothetical protein HYV39_04100 [Candidatus Levybacteria bacterium]|nr:hypothetical protein [Candidatus Levybacteria bacterium]